VFCCVLGSEGWVLVPRSSGTPVATWAWPTWVVSRRRVLEAAFILLEFPSPSRRIFIGSHSLPPSLVRRIGPSACESFKLFFHLWNPNGLALARISSRSDSGPRCDWTIKHSKKQKKHTVKHFGSDVSGTSTMPKNCGSGTSSVFSRINFNLVPDRFLKPHQPASSSCGVNHTPCFQPHSNFKRPALTFLSGANRIPIGRQRPTSPSKGSPRPSCSYVFPMVILGLIASLASGAACAFVWDM
jgi:hypothetical protein